MKRFLLVILLFLIFILAFNYSYTHSVLFAKTENVWWCNVFPSYIMNDLDDSISFDKKIIPEKSNNIKKSKIQFKFKIIELFQ